ncbi:MBL fold metallo-hydrolase [Thalassovita aquimarina]
MQFACLPGDAFEMRFRDDLHVPLDLVKLQAAHVSIQSNIKSSMRNTMTLSRRTLFSGAAGAAAALAASSLPRIATAKAPLATSHQSGVVRRRVGSLEVTALLDGYLEMTPELFGAPLDEAARLATEQFKGGEPNLSPVNAFLVNLGDRLVLIDTGAANSFGPTLGRLPEALAANGVSPAQIDAILLTHMHPDHIAGVIDANGNAVFPNAEMIVPEADFAYWHDDASMSAAPNAFKPFFKGARLAAKAYEGRTTKISGEADVFGALKAVPLPGHTPGHTGYILNSGDASLFIWGDTVHNATYQLAHPEWGPAFDVDPEMAANSRKRALDMSAADRLLIAGMHMPFPAVGHIATENLGYKFVPAEWPYAL